MGDAEGFALVEKLAGALGGVVAGSRGAFDEGWIAEEQIVGVGGEFIAPDLYVACGISGDIYHYFGLQEAKFVVAINPDENAPIMKVANMAVVGDAEADHPGHAGGAGRLGSRAFLIRREARDNGVPGFPLFCWLQLNYPQPTPCPVRNPGRSIFSKLVISLDQCRKGYPSPLAT